MEAPDPFSYRELLEGDRLEKQLDDEPFMVTLETLTRRARMAEDNGQNNEVEEF